MKIQQAANQAGLSTQKFCDLNSNKFRSIFDSYDIGYDKFIRTSSDEHKNNVQNFYQSLDDRGYIYKGDYKGWYCVSDESFLTESQVIDKTLPDGSVIKVSDESGHKVEWSTETNYMFKMNSVRSDLEYWLKSDERVKPKRFLKQLRKMASMELPDLSVSRHSDRVSWGVPVPNDSSHTIYVWMDALVNYLSAANCKSFNSKNERFSR